jgi:hypothetical protein
MHSQPSSSSQTQLDLYIFWVVQSETSYFVCRHPSRLCMMRMPVMMAMRLFSRLMIPFVSAVHKMRPFLSICLMRLVQSFELLLGCVEPSSVIDHGTFLVRLARNNAMDGSSKIRCGVTNISCGRQIEPFWRRFEMRVFAIHGRSVCWRSECCLSEGIFRCVFLSYYGLGEFLCPLASSVSFRDVR